MNPLYIFLVIIIISLIVIIIKIPNVKKPTINKSETEGFSNIKSQPNHQNTYDDKKELYTEINKNKTSKDFDTINEKYDDIRNSDKYKKLYTRPEWDTKRDEILERDNHTCQWYDCDCKDNLQVHHKWYCAYPNGKVADPWDYPDNCFMTLCEYHHKVYHKKYKIKTYFREFKTDDGQYPERELNWK